VPTPETPGASHREEQQVLQLSGVTRRFGETVAVDHVSFDVPAGRVVGFVGANGAGKTTTMRIAMGVLAADEGEVSWQGAPVTSGLRRRFGYMPEERGLYPKQPVREQLIYLTRLRGAGATQARSQVDDLLERFGLGERRKDKLETLSLGNQQRAQIIAAVLADPIALVLDEPFSGLDPAAVDQMSHLLREHTAVGTPVLFSSHQLDLVDRLCDSIVVLHQGRVVARGTSEELRHGAPLRYRLVLADDAGWVRNVPGVTVVDLEGRTALVEPTDEQAAAALVRRATERDEVHDFARLVPTLSEIYREVAA
jgi:ABC-2 type transport system ATP-binding protein